MSYPGISFIGNTPAPLPPELSVSNMSPDACLTMTTAQDIMAHMAAQGTKRKLDNSQDRNDSTKNPRFSSQSSFSKSPNLRPIEPLASSGFSDVRLRPNPPVVTPLDLSSSEPSCLQAASPNLSPTSAALLATLAQQPLSDAELGPMMYSSESWTLEPFSSNSPIPSLPASTSSTQCDSAPIPAIVLNMKSHTTKKPSVPLFSSTSNPRSQLSSSSRTVTATSVRLPSSVSSENLSLGLVSPNSASSSTLQNLPLQKLSSNVVSNSSSTNLSSTLSFGLPSQGLRFSLQLDNSKQDLEYITQQINSVAYQTMIANYPIIAPSLPTASISDIIKSFLTINQISQNTKKNFLEKSERELKKRTTELDNTKKEHENLQLQLLQLKKIEGERDAFKSQVEFMASLLAKRHQV